MTTLLFTLTVEADVGAFESDLPAFIGRIASALGVRTSHVSVTVASGSVVVSVRVLADDASQAAAATQSWSSLTSGSTAAGTARLSASLGVPVLGFAAAPQVASELVLVAPPPPSPPAPPTLGSPPAAVGANSTSALSAQSGGFGSLFAGLDVSGEILIVAVLVGACLGVGILLLCCRRLSSRLGSRTAKPHFTGEPSFAASSTHLRSWPAAQNGMAASASSLELHEFTRPSVLTPGRGSQGGGGGGGGGGFGSVYGHGVMEDFELGDVSTSFTTPARAYRPQSQAGARSAIIFSATFEYEGPIGLVLGGSDAGHAMVHGVKVGSEAEAQGVCAGALIVAVNDVGVRGLPKVAVRDMLATAPRPLTIQLEVPDPEVDTRSWTMAPGASPERLALERSEHPQDVELRANSLARQRAQLIAARARQSTTQATVGPVVNRL